MHGACGCPRTWPSAPGSASSTGGAGSRTPSGPGCCSPSATRRGARWPWAGGSCRPPGSAADPAKYKNSTETPIYSKRRTLYALNWAKQDIIASGEVVVCEGYTDVIGFFQAGVPRAVATCGTALAEEHFTLLRNFATRIVLAFDADGAGQIGRRRAFYEWERTLEVDVAVAALPPGRDPADLARSDPAALRGAVEGAKPFLQFRLERILDAADLVDARGPGPGRRRTHWPRWPSTPTTWSATST